MTFSIPKPALSIRTTVGKDYFSYSIANKEPNRDDFEAGMDQIPKPEHLRDIELGVEKTSKNYGWSATLYYMNYKDQLVLTGKINDVGAYTRTNIPKSYRTGLELEGTVKITSWFHPSANLTLSKNRVENFAEFIDDYDNGGQKMNVYKSTEIAFSPSVVGAVNLQFLPSKNWRSACPQNM